MREKMGAEMGVWPIDGNAEATCSAFVAHRISMYFIHFAPNSYKLIRNDVKFFVSLRYVRFFSWSRLPCLYVYTCISGICMCMLYVCVSICPYVCMSFLFCLCVVFTTLLYLTLISFGNVVGDDF